MKTHIRFVCLSVFFGGISGLLSAQQAPKGSQSNNNVQHGSKTYSEDEIYRIKKENAERNENGYDAMKKTNSQGSNSKDAGKTEQKTEATKSKTDVSVKPK